MYKRALSLPVPPDRTFFLWGPRQTGKTSLLESAYPDAPFVSLLRNEELMDLQARPGRLRERVLDLGARFVVIDEVQKVPALLDEIHYMIEKDRIVFGLCGSSARRLKRAGANMLGGRAVRHELFGLTAGELGADFDPVRVLNSGTLPAIYQSRDPGPLLKSYCVDYLKEEIFDEGLVRKLVPFSRFLEFAALSDTQIMSYETFARDVGVSGPTIRSYFEILSDTLIGSFLPAYVLRPKRKVIRSPKFYFFDVGVVNALAQRGAIRPRSELFGKAFEAWVHHELRTYLSYSGRIEGLSYWKIQQGPEVDFIVGHMRAAFEAKASDSIHADHTRGLRELIKDYPGVGARYVVCLEKHSRRTEDGIGILSVADFTSRLWSGKLF
jgi:predicted AAA+ superfamily ATPase